MAKCLVTGGLGFIGSNLVKKLVEEGHDVIVIDNLSTGDIRNKNRKTELIIADIQDESIYKELPVVDYVFHLAALARIQNSIQDPISANNVNVNGTLNILEFCKKVNAKLIFSSSSSIYEGSELPTKETSEIMPKNPYALQKYICEQWIKMYSDLYSLDYTILRYFNVYGESQILTGAYAAVIGIFLNQKKNGQPLTITNDGEQRRDFTYVGDVVNANIAATHWDKDVYNIGTGVNYSVNEIAEMISEDKVYIGNRIGEVQETLADNSKAKNRGWDQTMSIKQWINEQS